MALGWAIYGTWDWKYDGYEILVHGDLNTRFFSHEIFWTRITRITRIFFCTRISLISRILSSWCLNTNLTNNTNFIWHTDLIFFSTRISLISRILSLRLVVNDNSLWLLTRCGYWLVVVIDLLWLLTRYGYWLIVVIDLLWLLTRCGYWLVMF